MVTDEFCIVIKLILCLILGLISAILFFPTLGHSTILSDKIYQLLFKKEIKLNKTYLGINF
jgi:hypothetical protein